MTRQDAKPGAFYLLPKIHKPQRPPPGRPIVSAIGTPTERISQFIDFFLLPFLETIPSYVKDTTHFLKIIEEIHRIDPNSLLVALDVDSLYTNVSLAFARRAIALALNLIRRGALHPTNQSLIRLLDLIFEKNLFTFCDTEDIHYFVQNLGVSMGSKCSPAVACTFMALFEQEFVSTYRLQPLLWKRYIDDIVIFWQHGEDELVQFVDYLNNCLPRIKFTLNFLKTSIDLLPMQLSRITVDPSP